MKFKFPRPDFMIALCLFLAFGAFYIFAAQINLTFDGAAFLSFFDDFKDAPHPHHLLFGKLLWLSVWIGKQFGLRPMQAGQYQSAFFMSLALVSFYYLLRRYRVRADLAIIFVFLLGFNETTLENATSVEMYAAALLAVSLSFHAFKSQSTSPGWLNAILLILACLIILLFHLGFAFCVLALYLTLARHARSWLGRIGYLLHGAVVLGLFVFCSWLAGMLTEHEYGASAHFFEAYWRLNSVRDFYWRLLNAPLFDFASYAGLILFPAALGWGLLRRRYREVATLWLLSSFFFWGFYSFWIADRGSFYLPLQLAWGLMAALAVRELPPQVPRRRLSQLTMGMLIYATLFVIFPMRLHNLSDDFESPWLSGAFWFFNFVLAGMGMVIARRPPRPRPAKPTTYHFYLLIAATASLIAFIPYLVESSRPDYVTRRFDAFNAMAPKNARLITAMIVYRAAQQSLRETISFKDDVFDENRMKGRRVILNSWLCASVGPRAMPVYFDVDAYDQLDTVWGRYGTKPWVDIPREHIEFVPTQYRDETFYLAKWNPYQTDAEQLKREEPHPAEDWGGVSVQWTKRSAKFKIKPQGNRLVVSYQIGHPDISYEYPVGVEFRVNDAVVATPSHTAAGIYEAVIDLKTQTPVELKISVNRFWISPDGRELGVAVYPFKFVSPSNSGKPR